MDYDADLKPLLRELAANYQRDMTTSLAALWWRTFKDADPDALRAAAAEHMRASDYFPRISEIARALDDLTAARALATRPLAAPDPLATPRGRFLAGIEAAGADMTALGWWDSLCRRLQLRRHWHDCVLVAEAGRAAGALVVAFDQETYDRCRADWERTLSLIYPALLERARRPAVSIRLAYFTGDEAGTSPALAAGREDA